MEEYDTVPTFLGRPFLAIGRTVIDVEKGESILRLGNKEFLALIKSPRSLCLVIMYRLLTTLKGKSRVALKGNLKPYKKPIKEWRGKYNRPHKPKLITKVFLYRAEDDTHGNKTTFKVKGQKMRQYKKEFVETLSTTSIIEPNKGFSRVMITKGIAISHKEGDLLSTPKRISWNSKAWKQSYTSFVPKAILVLCNRKKK
ncbi:hypothetical protein CR513_00820, partial [Mucuna pruriens]